MDSTILKVKFNNFCKLFPIPENFTKFTEIITEKFKIKNFDIKDYRITFNDNENDLILIETNFDFEILKSYKNKQIKLNLIKINKEEEKNDLNNNNIKNVNNNNNKEEKEEENWRGKNFNKNFWDKKFNKNIDNNNNNDNSSSSSSNDEYKKFPQKFIPFPSPYFFRPPFFHHPGFKKHGKKCHNFHNCFQQQQQQQNKNEKINFKKNPNEIFENINYHIKKDNKDLNMLITNQNLFFKFLEKSAEKMEIKLFLFNNGNQPWPENVYLINDEKYSALKGDKIKIDKKISVNELCQINVVLNTKDVKKGKYLTVWNLMTENDEKIGDSIFMKIKVCVKKERKDKKNIKNENNNDNDNDNNNNDNNNNNNNDNNNNDNNNNNEINFNKENSTIKSEDIKFEYFDNVNK